MVVELFDKVMLYNEYGILENEIIKPEANLRLVDYQSILEEIYIFFNSQTNEVYLLDTYGNLKHKAPVSCGKTMDYVNNTLVSWVSEKVMIYNFK